MASTDRQRMSGRRHQLFDCVAVLVDYLPEFLFFANAQSHGRLLEQTFLLRSDVRQYWPLFAREKGISPPPGLSLSPSRVSYAIIRTYSPAGARPKALVVDRNIIWLAERALDTMHAGIDKRKELIKAHADENSRSSELISNKWGVCVSSNRECIGGDISLGTVSLCAPAEQCPVLELTITNNSFVDITLVACYLLFDQHGFKIDKSPVKFPLKLRASAKHRVFVGCEADQIGVRRDWCVFDANTAGGDSFRIVRFLSVKYTDSITSDPTLQVIQPFKPRPTRFVRPDDNSVVEGERPPLPSRNKLDFMKFPLREYNEATVEGLLSSGLFVAKYTQTGRAAARRLNTQQKQLLEMPLCKDSYTKKLLLMLLLEHRQEEVDIHNYDMPDAVMQISGPGLALRVPGLSENRPSILRNDHLVACKQGERQRFRGYAHEVRMDEVVLHFNKSFHLGFVKNQKCEIEFCINPNPYWGKNRAVASVSEEIASSILFPDEQCLEVTVVRSIDRFFDQKLEANPQQRQAVQHIVAGSSGEAPYLIFGPPGTGKTTTVVESIKQVYRLKGTSRIKGTPRILVCTPSNSAADLVTCCLLEHIDARHILRLNALSRSKSSLAEGVEEVSVSDGEIFYFPSLEDIMGFRIVICTLSSSGRLVSSGMRRGHFSHIFIDECGHAVEAECLIPLSGLAMPGQTQVVLAGDPHQLGPIVRSSQAQSSGLSISLLERLMTKCDLYQRRVVSGQTEYETRAVTKLLRNYRSHPSIIELPNEFFYDRELEVFADKMAREMLCDWERLPEMGKENHFPIIFNGIEGTDQREASSPSFFNLEEMSRVLYYVEELRKCRRPQISALQIGVISPYHKQVMRIRKALSGKCHGEVKVGSVEEFQGQERLVIIISTVRSQQKYMSLDKTFNLGFLRNKKRFNVAITRAKALLIVIGNPFILRHDEHWSKFLNFAIANGGYTGCKYSDGDEAEFRAKMENLSLNSGHGRASAAAAKSEAAMEEGVEYDLCEDPGWRREE